MEHYPQIEKYYEGRLLRKQVEMNAVLKLAAIIQQNKASEGVEQLFTPQLLTNLGIKVFCALQKNKDGWVTSNCFGLSVAADFLLKNKNLAQVHKTTLIKESALANEADLHYFEWAVPVFFDNEVHHLLLVSIQKDQDDNAISELLTFMQTIVGMLVVSIENQQLLEYKIRQENIRQEIEIARQVQNLLFPKKLPNTPELQLFASYMPQLGVSGDYYDFIEIDAFRFLVCVADVSGKGVPAALLMSNFQATLRTLVKQGLHLNQIVIKLNDILCENSNLERFITAFLAIIDKKTQTIHYINAGHNPPVLIDEDGNMNTLTRGTTILGVLNPLPFVNEDILKLKGINLLAAFTDGLTETDNLEGEEFGSDRVEAFFKKNYQLDLPNLHQEITQIITSFCGPIGFKDDITILTCRVNMQG